ncbi:hypothetical protein [Pseudocolwellia agarivorans]|uniref:hypothetical protein n=1 Tax=Pseudocolwellia agarivorans TaxID=1911682 RepID=UPI000984D8AC|nr:hypothetical protein [Pseudocolwellia agarivorans]
MKFFVLTLPVVVSLTLSFTALSAENPKVNELTEHQQWLKNKFNEQHNNLIPIVAVADILFACNNANNNAYGKYTLDTLITKMSKERLAEKLESCLGGELVSSDTAINYGLLGCFHGQLDDLPEDKKVERMKLVKKAISSLSKEERKKSFTQCVTDQSISYLK